MSRSNLAAATPAAFTVDGRFRVAAWRLGNGSIVFVDPYGPGLEYFERPGAWRRALLVASCAGVPATRLLGVLPDGQKVRWLTGDDDSSLFSAEGRVWVAARRWADELPAFLATVYPTTGTRAVVEAWNAIRHPDVSAAALVDGFVEVTVPVDEDGQSRADGLLHHRGGRPVARAAGVWQLPPSEHAVNLAYWYGSELWLPVLELPPFADWRPWIAAGVDPGRVPLFWRAGFTAQEAATANVSDDTLRLLGALANVDPASLQLLTDSAHPPMPRWR